MEHNDEDTLLFRFFFGYKLSTVLRKQRSMFTSPLSLQFLQTVECWESYCECSENQLLSDSVFRAARQYFGSTSVHLEHSC